MPGFIGEYLLSKGLITQEQLQDALEEQKRYGGRVGEVLVKKGYISEKDFVQTISEQLGIPFIDIANYEIDLNAVKLFSLKLAKQYQAIPINKVRDAITVAMADPLNVMAVDEIKKKLGLTVKSVFALPSEINKAVEKYYGTKISEQTYAATGKLPLKERGEVDLDTLVKEATEGPVVSLVNSIFTEAVESGASDIHFEPEEDHLYVRLRIDGVLQDIKPLSKDVGPAVISRIKILADMDIAEKRLPQDGRTKADILDKEIDLRISTLPTIYGENVAIRLLDKSQASFKLDDIGFRPDDLKIFKEECRRPYGIVLVTGPTGSGKTTTLYGVLTLINDLKKNIITLEDPIEYVVPRVRQVQLNVKAGLTFANGLRSILRHDPDIIMIGEIRDKETAEIAIHAALTGHLVFSTLHTNDAASASSRLIDMGIESFLVASALNSILAQRLVRCLCPKCKKEYKPAELEIEALNLQNSDKEAVLYKEVGCSQCRYTGYKGRTGIFEFLVIDEVIKELILKKIPAYQIKDQAVKNGMCILEKAALEKLLGGITSVSEVIRMSGGM